MNPENNIAENGRCGPKWRGLGLYFSLLSVQTVGAVLLLANTIPLYRLVAMDFSNYRPDAGPWWGVAGTLLIQGAYWLRMHLEAPPPQARNVLLGHVLAFFARISFVAVTACFSVMFLNRFQDLKHIRDMNYLPLRALGLLIVFFSLFCWVLELERMAKGLQDKPEASERHRDEFRRRT